MTPESLEWFAATLREQKPHLFPIKSAFAALIDGKPPSNIPVPLTGRGTRDSTSGVEATERLSDRPNTEPGRCFMTKYPQSLIFALACRYV